MVVGSAIIVRQEQGAEPMKKLILLILLLSPFVFLNIAQAKQDNSDVLSIRNLNFVMGKKEVDDNDLKNHMMHSMRSFALKTDFKKDSWPVSGAIDFIRSYGSEHTDHINGGAYNTRISTYELALGARKIVEVFDGFSLFAGGGVSVVTAEMVLKDISSVEEVTVLGSWVDAGVIRIDVSVLLVRLYYLCIQ